jgi:hypothetical protein
MRGVDLHQFDFDYDLVWAALFLNADGHVYGRYGSRDAGPAEQYLSLAGLHYAMERALAAHRQTPERWIPDRLPQAPRTVEEYPAAHRLRANACIHCHQVYDFRRQALQAAGRWRPDDVWVYPLPQNVGLALDVGQGDRIAAVTPDSPAARAGLRADDRLTSLAGEPVASIADVQHTLHRAPAIGRIPLSWERDGAALSGTLELGPRWRETDLSWRASLRRVGPSPAVHGDDLSAEERRQLGLSERSLALRQGNFVSAAARKGGIRQNDIIVGLEDRPFAMTAGQFLMHIRLHYEVGSLVTFNILRQGRPLRARVTLPPSPPS